MILVTGEKNRGTTQEKLWHNQDKQLTTPKHDEMILWLLNKENAINIIPGLRVELAQYFISLSPIVQETADVINYCADNGFQVNSSALDILKRIPKEKMPEITSGADPTKLVLSQEHINFIKEMPFLDIKIESEVPLLSGNFIIGYLDILVTVKSSTYSFYAIEVKPQIPSLGETLRQLNTYRKYLPNVKIFLFTCDLGFKSAFEGQGITVLEYDP